METLQADDHQRRGATPAWPGPCNAVPVSAADRIEQGLALVARFEQWRADHRNARDSRALLSGYLRFHALLTDYLATTGLGFLVPATGTPTRRHVVELFEKTGSVLVACRQVPPSATNDYRYAPYRDEADTLTLTPAEWARIDARLREARHTLTDLPIDPAWKQRALKHLVALQWHGQHGELPIDGFLAVLLDAREGVKRFGEPLRPVAEELWAITGTLNASVN